MFVLFRGGKRSAEPFVPGGSTEDVVLAMAINKWLSFKSQPV